MAILMERRVTALAVSGLFEEGQVVIDAHISTIEQLGCYCCNPLGKDHVTEHFRLLPKVFGQTERLVVCGKITLNGISESHQMPMRLNRLMANQSHLFCTEQLSEQYMPLTVSKNHELVRKEH